MSQCSRLTGIYKNAPLRVLLALLILAFSFSPYLGSLPLLHTPVVFDVPSLTGKNISQVRQILGPPDYSPKMGPLNHIWEATWEQQGFLMRVRYDSKSGRVVDFLINSANDTNADGDANLFKAIAGVADDNPAYEIVHIPSSATVAFAGIRVVPRVPD